MNAMVRRLQPRIIINNRSMLPEDIGTPEERIQAEGAGRDWEACMTFNGAWGYMPTPSEDYLSTRKVLDMLRMCTAGQGNLLLNVGPRPDGSLPEEAVERLTQAGRWLKQYGTAVYGPVDRATLGLPESMLGNWSRKGRKLYFWCRQWPGRELTIGGLKSKVSKVRLFPDGKPLEFEQLNDPRIFCSGTNERLVIRGLPEKCPDPIAQVALLEITVTSVSELGIDGKWDSPFMRSWKVSGIVGRGAGVAKAPPVSLKQAMAWQPIEADPGGFVDAHNRFGDADGLLYLATEIRVLAGGTWNVLLGHDGGVRMFVDGKPVFKNLQQQNPAPPSRSVFPLTLRKGTHEVVVALDTAGGMGWGIFLRFQIPMGRRNAASKPAFPLSVL
jgi:hypothetical protein